MSRSVQDLKKDSAAMDAADEALDERIKFQVLRIRSEEVGGCDACGGVIAAEKFVLCIKAGSPKPLNILLCESHEGDLLKRLLWSYLRRMKGVETVGFCGPLPKDVVPGDPIPNPA